MSSFFKSGAASDPVYCVLRDGLEDRHVKGRQYFDRIWQESAEYIDFDAPGKATRDLVSVFWELQLAYFLKCAGKSLVPRDRLDYKNNTGPDLFADCPDVWLEAVVVRCGTGPDALQEDPAAIGNESYDPDGVVLRLRSAIRDKSRKLKNYAAAGIIRPGQATVIAISGAMLPYRTSGQYPPEVVRAVYPANNPVIPINRVTMERGEAYIEYRHSIEKRLGSPVATDVFLDPEYAHVSAVLYDESHWVNPPDPPGSLARVVHNSMATTPLPDGWFPSGDEFWWCDGGSLEHIRNGA